MIHKLKAYISSRRVLVNTLVALAMVLLLILMQEFRHGMDKPGQTLIVRDMDIARLTPPPPPPPSQAKVSSNTTPQLILPQQAEGVSLRVNPMDVVLPEVIEPNLTQNEKKSLVVDFAMATTDVMAEIETFGLEQLDMAPRLLNRINARIPAEIAAQGVREVKLMLHVIIHEDGKVELLGTQALEYPQLAPLAEQIARQARFTSPQRHGEKVKAEFYWPVRIKA